MVLRSTNSFQYSERNPNDVDTPQASESTMVSSLMLTVSKMDEERQLAVDLLENERTRDSEEPLWPAAR